MKMGYFWNSPCEMNSTWNEMFHIAGGWDDDCDWVIFCPRDMPDPPFVSRFDAKTFTYPNGTQGRFIACYHA